jgi:hypothetical protein
VEDLGLARAVFLPAVDAGGEGDGLFEAGVAGAVHGTSILSELYDVSSVAALLPKPDSADPIHRLKAELWKAISQSPELRRRMGGSPIFSITFGWHGACNLRIRVSSEVLF